MVGLKGDLFPAGSGLAWESERIAGPELGHTTHNIVRFRWFLSDVPYKITMTSSSRVFS